MITRSLGLLCLVVLPGFASAQEPKPQLDSHGFPLPEGAIARLGDLHFAQRGWVNGIVVSDDGKVVATAGEPYRRHLRGYGDFEDAHLYLWNAETGRITHDIPLGLHARPTGFSKDGKLLATTSNRGFQFVDVAKGKLYWPNDRPERPAFVKPHFFDGDRLMVGHNYKDVEVWDVAKGTLVRSWKLTKKDVHRVEKLKLEGHDIRVSLSPSGATMAWFVRTPLGRFEWPSRAEVHVFDTLTGERKGSIKFHGYYSDAALLDEGDTVLIATTFLGADPAGSQDSGGNVALDVKTGKERFRIHHIVGREDGHIVPTRNPIEGFRLTAVAPDGKSFYTFGTRSLRERRDMATGKVLAKLDSYARGEESIFGFAADGKRTVVGDECRWYWGDFDLKPLAPRTEWSYFFPTARYLSADRIRFPGADNAFFRVWGLGANKVVETGSLPPRPKLHPEPASLDWRHPKGRDAEYRILVSNYQRQLVVYDRAEGRIRCRLEGIFANGPDDRNWPVVSADGELTIVPQLIGKDFVVSSFDTRTGRRMATHRVPAADVFPGVFPFFPLGDHTRPAVAWYAEDASVFGYHTRDGRLTLVDTRTGTAIRTLGFAGPLAKDPEVKRPAPVGDPARAPVQEGPDPIPPIPAWGYTTRPDRPFIVASMTTFVKAAGYEYALFDRKTGEVLRRRLLSSGGAFSHDGRFVFARRNVEDVYIYETATNTLRGIISTGGGPGLSLVIAPDDRTMATGCADTSILVWDLNRPLGGEPDLPPADAPRAKVGDYWRLLGEVERKKVEPALWALVRGPKQTLALLKENLRPAKEPEPGLFEDPQAPPSSLRELRALEVVERIGTAEAKEIVETVAGGHADALLTREARQVLSRWP